MRPLPPHVFNMQQPQGKLSGLQPPAPESPGPTRSCPCPGTSRFQNRAAPGTELSISPGPASRSRLALPGEGTRAGAQRRGTRASAQLWHAPCPCPGTERQLGWCLCWGEGRGRGGRAVPVVALSNLPGGFTPHALNALSREGKYWKISPFCTIPTVAGSPGICKTGPCASQRPSGPCQPRGQDWHWAGNAMGPGIAFSTYLPGASPAPCTERGTQPVSNGAQGVGLGGCCFPVPSSLPPAPHRQHRRLRCWQGRQGPAAPCP